METVTEKAMSSKAETSVAEISVDVIRKAMEETK